MRQAAALALGNTLQCHVLCSILLSRRRRFAIVQNLPTVLQKGTCGENNLEPDTRCTPNESTPPAAFHADAQRLHATRSDDQRRSFITTIRDGRFVVVKQA
jgi:hypothetical protein